MGFWETDIILKTLLWALKFHMFEYLKVMKKSIYIIA